MVSVNGELVRGSAAGAWDATIDDCSLGMLQKLFPRGYAWDSVHEPSEPLYKYAQGLAREFCRVDRRIAQLPVEAYPGTTTELISDWEAIVGQDDCAPQATTLAERRTSLVNRISDKTSIAPADMSAKVLNDQGVEAAYIAANCRPMTCESPCDWALYQNDWRYRVDVLTEDDANSNAACQALALLPQYVIPTYTEGRAPEWLTDATFVWRAGPSPATVVSGSTVVGLDNKVDAGAADFANPDSTPPYVGALLQCGGYPYPYFWTSVDTVNYLTGDTVSNLVGGGPEWHVFVIFTAEAATISGANAEDAHRIFGNDSAGTQVIGAYFQDNGGTLNVHAVANDGTVLSTTHAGTYGQKHVLEMWGTGTELRSRLDDSAEQVTSGLGSLTSTVPAILLGGETGAIFNGAVHEIAFFNDELVSTERSEVRAFLSKMHPEITV